MGKDEVGDLGVVCEAKVIALNMDKISKGESMKRE